MLDHDGLVVEGLRAVLQTMQDYKAHLPHFGLLPLHAPQGLDELDPGVSCVLRPAFAGAPSAVSCGFSALEICFAKIM